MLKIREIREEKGLTQKQLAEMIGVDGHNVGDWERSKCEPSASMLIKLSTALEVSVDYLVGNSDDFGNIIVSSQSTDQNLSLNEKEMLESFKHLSLFEQDSILVQVKALAEKYKVKK